MHRINTAPKNIKPAEASDERLTDFRRFGFASRRLNSAANWSRLYGG